MIAPLGLAPCALAADEQNDTGFAPALQDSRILDPAADLWATADSVTAIHPRQASSGFADFTAWTHQIRHTDGEQISVTVNRLAPAAPHESSPHSENIPWFNETVDVTYKHDWKPLRSYTHSGLEVALKPHTGLTYGQDGANAEAGAILQIGQNLEELAQDGDVAFGDRPRWYLFAAGTKRAVGYNLARTRDGGLSHAGISHDRGGSQGDATIGVAYRRGPIESSIGLVYRENETEGLRGYQGIRTDVDEGILAFRFAFRPR